MALLEEHQYFTQRSLFHAFLLIEDLAGFKLLNSPFRCATLCVFLVSLRISRLSDSLCDIKRAASDQCESLFSPLRSRVCLLEWTWDSLSKYRADGVIIKQNKHSFAARVSCADWENKALCDAWVTFPSAPHSFGPGELGCCFLWPDSYLPSFSFCLHHSSLPLFLLNLQLPCLLPHVICCSPSFIHYRPINLSDRFGTRLEGAGVDSKGVCLLCDLCTTVRSRDQKAAACWLSEDLWSNSGIRDVVLYIAYVFWSLSLIILISTTLLCPTRCIPPSYRCIHCLLFKLLWRERGLCTSVSLHMICLLSSALLIPVSPALTEPSSHQAGDSAVRVLPMLCNRIKVSTTHLARRLLVWEISMAFKTLCPQFVTQASCKRKKQSPSPA